MSEYQGPERRRPSTRAEIADMVAEGLDERLAQMETNFYNHVNLKVGQLELSLTSNIKQIVEDAIDKHIDDAFPDGPLHRHKDHHQKLIDNAESGKKIKLDLQIWAARGVLLFIFSLLLLGGKEWLLRELAK